MDKRIEVGFYQSCGNRECWMCVGCGGVGGVGGAWVGAWTRVWKGGVVLCLCESGFFV